MNVRLLKTTAVYKIGQHLNCFIFFFLLLFMFSLLYCYLDNRLCAVFLGYIKILFFKDMATLDHDLFICFLLSF